MRSSTEHQNEAANNDRRTEMYGPTAMQVDAGHWQHDALRDANSHRRGHTDTDYLNEMEQAHHRAAIVRLVAATATVLVALAVIVLI
jgi:transposase-like protein